MSISLKVFDEDSNTYVYLLLTQDEYDKALIDNEYLRELVEKEKCSEGNLSVAVTDASQPEPSIELHSPRLQENPETLQVEEESTATSLYIWTNPCILLLLSLYEDNKENFNSGAKRHKKIWDNIAKSMKEINSNYSVTGGQCQTKMNGLKRTYKKIKDHNNKSGNDTASWPFYQRMDEIFGRTGWAQPLALASEAGPSPANTSDAPRAKKKPNILEKYIMELKEERIQKTKERDQARQEKIRLKQEQFNKMMEMKERQHREKMEILKSLWTKK